MNRIAVVPRDKLHWLEMKSRVLSSTEVSVLFGCSPYATLFELWHIKKQQKITHIEENDRMKWGLRHEDSIANGIAEDFQCKVRKINKFVYIDELRLGASFDYGIVDTGDKVIAPLEIKNVDYFEFKRNWMKKGDHIEAPFHIEFQLQQQMLLGNKEQGYLAVHVGGNQTFFVHRIASPKIHAEILDRTRLFWESIDANNEPAPDFIKDADFLFQLFNRVKPDSIVDFDDSDKIKSLVKQYIRLRDAETEMKERKKSKAAELLTLFGDTEKAKGTIDGMPVTISMGISKDESKRTFRID